MSMPPAIGVWALWLILLLTTWPANALTQYECLDVLKNFADSYMAPRNEQIAKSVNSTLFAEDVYGTIDVSTNFDGRELSTEYLFGLFVNIGKFQTSPEVLGIPRGYNVTHALVQHNTVSAYIAIQYEYPTLNETYPIEIGAFFNINEQRQIQEYDLTFRRFGWATDTIIPQLIPQMADYIGINSDNDTYVLQQYIGQTVCNASLTYCNGSNEHYESMGDCMSFLDTRPIGPWYRLGEDNLGCRYLHTQMLSLRPQVHCPHVGRSGGMFCVPRDYRQVTMESHFPKGFLAPKFITPENKDSVQDIYVTNGTDLSPLLDISLSQFDMHSWEPSLFATSTFAFILILYASSKISYLLFHRFNDRFKLLRPRFQINVVMYSLNIFYTTVALALELASTPVFASHYALWMVKSLRISGVMVCALYCFELIYRHDMRWALIIHHILTIFAISFTVSVFEYTQSMSYMRSAIIWLFQATTEQTVFVGLMGYRLRWSPERVAKILKWSAVQTLVLKCSSAIALIIYWGVEQNYSYRSIDGAWSAMIWIIGIGLLATQFWGSYVVWVIGRRVASNDVATNGTTSPAHYHADLVKADKARVEDNADDIDQGRSPRHGHGDLSPVPPTPGTTSTNNNHYLHERYSADPSQRLMTEAALPAGAAPSVFRNQRPGTGNSGTSTVSSASSTSPLRGYLTPMTLIGDVAGAGDGLDGWAGGSETSTNPQTTDAVTSRDYVGTGVGRGTGDEQPSSLQLPDMPTVSRIHLPYMRSDSQSR